jgi:hypothetical protein
LEGREQATYVGMVRVAVMVARSVVRVTPRKVVEAVTVMVVRAGKIVVGANWVIVWIVLVWPVKRLVVAVFERVVVEIERVVRWIISVPGLEFVRLRFDVWGRRGNVHFTS